MSWKESGKILRCAGLRSMAGGLLVGFLLTGAVSSVFANSVSPKPARMVLGWKEFARLETEGLRLDAKLDTGADNSSIHAVNIEEFEKDGVVWVRFVVVNEKGESKALERLVERTVRIRQHEGEQDRRYVVKLTLSLGPLSKEVEVNLTDRSRFSIPLLLGRSFLYPEILVDSGMSYTVN